MTSLMVDPDALAARRSLTAGSGAAGAAGARLSAHLDAVLARPLYVPEAKALLSRWGAHCRDDEHELAFDPFAPHQHRCTHCGRIWSTDQTHRWWVYWYQLWLAERVWLLALHSGPGGRPDAEARALEALAALAQRYGSWPNADNVLGPSRPFFSTYLESIWVLHLAAAASLLDAQHRLPSDLGRDLRAHLFAPSAAIIADFPEGRSNRQVWNATALFALGRVLADAPLARDAVHGTQGLLTALDGGLAADGLWYEGENYHWFALRGFVWGADLMARAGEVDLWHDAGVRGAAFRAAFRAPVRTALPDLTAPARRDAKFGVPLRDRRMAELWELALARGVTDPAWTAALLGAVYDETVPARDDLPATITEVERAEPPAGVRREQLGWRGWLAMVPELPPAAAEWRGGSEHLEDTGLAIVRRDQGRTYVSLDYGEPGGGHGHPDRLNLTLVANGVPWLLDFGTGSYVAPSLAWYRTTLAHNAPLVDLLSQAPARGHCAAWDEAGPWAWICAQLPEGSAYDGVLLQRTVVAGPGYVLDVLQLLSSTGERQLAVPWHGLGRMVLDDAGAIFTRPEGTLGLRVAGRQPFQVLVQRAPGPPRAGGAEELEFPVVVAQGEEVTLLAVLDTGAGVEEAECVEDGYVVRLGEGRLHTHRPTESGWLIELDRGDPIELGGLRELPEPPVPDTAPVPVPGDRFTIGAVPGVARVPDAPAAAQCPRITARPALDGSLTGFDPVAPLHLNRADQFRRAEEPWGGPETFAATAWLNHDADTLYLAVEVTAPAPAFRPRDLPDPAWENENPDIHSDGLQVYVETPLTLYGWLLVPDADDAAVVRVATVRGSDAEPDMVAAGAWTALPQGYRITMALAVPEALEGPFGFDLYVNRARAGGERRTGQLVWSGARGSRLYLAGDRPLPGALPRVAVGT